VGDKPAFFQVTSQSEDEIVTSAERLYQQLKGYGNIYIKIPIDTSQKDDDGRYEGIKSIRKLSNKGIPVLATAVITPVQAFLASRAGAKYVALMLRPYDNLVAERLGLKELGEEGFLDDSRILGELAKRGGGLDEYLSGMDILNRTNEIFKNQRLETKLLIAGLRNPVQVSAVLEKNCVSAMTLPYKLFISLFGHEGTKRFVRDTYKAGDKDSIYGRFLKD
jgi:transaldolase